MINIKSSRKDVKKERAEKFDMFEVYKNLYVKSSKGENFNNLMKFIISEENILLAITNLKSNKGSKTPGVDGKNIKNLLAMDSNLIIQKVRKKLDYYQPKAVKRIEIPKPNGKTRPIGIPTILDRLVQQCILQVLEPICEAKFSNTSYGFRPGKSAEHAIAKTYSYIQMYNLHYVVNIDIESFFDNVNHKRLIRQMHNMGIHDAKLLEIIKAMLKAPIKLPNGNKIIPTCGTPQGGILSPILSNIVLNDLDKWIETQWEFFPSKRDYTTMRTKDGKTFLDKSNKNKMLAKSKLKKMYIVRYADDFKIFTDSEENAIKIYEATIKWLKERLTLNISKEKSGITNLKKHYMEFLGFEIKAIKKHNKYVVKSKISKKAIERLYKRIIELIFEWFKTNTFERRWNVLLKYNLLIVGFHNYYNIATRCVDNLRIISYIVFNKWKRIAKYDGYSKEIKNPKDAKGFLDSEYYKKYKNSSMMRYINSFPLFPLSYIRPRIAMSNNGYNKYLEKSEESNNELDFSWINELEFDKNENIEYRINRHLRIINVKAKCEITKQNLDFDNINCHHIYPRYLGGNDKYDNLIIISKDIHKLLHMVDNEKIKNMIKKLNLDAYQMRKVNKLREILNLPKVSKEILL